MKDFIAILFFGAMFATASPVGAKEREERNFSLYGGVFSGLGLAGPAIGGVVGVEFEIFESRGLTLSLTPRATMWRSKISNSRIDSATHAFVGDLTLSFWVRIPVENWFSIVAGFGGGVRHLHHSDTFVDDNVMLSARSYFSGLITADIIMEFRLSDTWRISPFVAIIYSPHQMVGFNLWDYKPVFEKSNCIMMGALVQVFFD